MKVEELALPQEFKASLQAKGFVELYPPQAAAIEAGVLEGRNLLVASPTASGKTLIAALAAYKKIVEGRRKVVYLSPLRALASEKYAEFRGLLEPFGVKVVISTGDFDSAGEALRNYDLLVLTNEKFDSLLRHGITWLPDVGLCVADEVHLAGSGDRGPTLEMILTKVMHSGIATSQLLSLSATVSNAEEIARWLRSDLVELTWRPVPLREGVYDHGRVWFGELQGEIETVRSTYGGAIDVAIDSIAAGGQSLIFASTRRRAVSLATKASELTSRHLSEQEKASCIEAARRIRESGEETGLSRLLADIVAKGSAFHHAGLPHEHRKIVEDAYRARAVKLLASTPTLCLPEGEEIFGNPSPVAIEKLTSDDRVLTHRNSFERVITPTMRPYSGPLVKVTPWCQLPMRMTPEHKVLRATRARHGNHSRGRRARHWWTYAEPEWIESRNLRVGDLVLFPVMKENVDMESVELPRIGPLKNQHGEVGRHWSRLKVQKLQLTEPMLEAMGIYIAEGYSQKKGQVMLAISTRESGLTGDILNWFESLGLRPKIIDSTRHRRVIRACSKQLSERFRELFGERAREKRIPHEFMLLPERKVIQLVKGMWRGDGETPSRRYRATRYSTVSKQLAKQLFALLVKIGYMPSIRVSRRAGRRAGRRGRILHRDDLYVVSISGKQIGDFVHRVLGIGDIPRVAVNREFNRGHRDSNYYYMPVRKVEIEKYDGLVYNLEVAKHSSYVGSFAVHNSAGVNLPARRVVIADLSRYDGEVGMSSALSVLEYRQMAGRAGRPQYDEFGETVMIPPPAYSAEDVMRHYVESSPEPIESRLGGERGMRIHLLAVIASRMGMTRGEIDSIFSKTLLAAQTGTESVARHVDDAFGYLFSEQLVVEKAGRFHATGFGKRVSTLYIDPMTGVLFKKNLARFELGPDNTIKFLHLIAKSPDFEPKFPLRERHYQEAYDFLETNRVSFLMGEQGRKSSFMEYEEALQDMRTVMVLNSWIDEQKEDTILERLGAEPGDLHRAVDNADWLLYCLGELAKLFGKYEVIKEADFLRKRVAVGVKSELVELTKLRGVGRVRARSLFNSGFRTIKSIKEAPAERLGGVEKIGPVLAQRIKEEATS